MNPFYRSLRPLLLPPVDWSRAFDRHAPLAVEIGFGNGDHLIRSARESPELNWIGLELRWGCVQRALRRVADAALSHVRILLLDARAAFPYVFPPRSIRRIQALFPPPWPKQKSAHRRTFRRAFLERIHDTLIPGGELWIVTDQEPYARWIAAEAPAESFALETGGAPAGLGTLFEEKWRRKGMTSFRSLCLRRRGSAELAPRGDTAMHTYRIPTFDPARFAPRDEHGDITVVFKEFLFDPKAEKGMLAAFLVEEGFQHSLWIRIERRAQDWIIAPASWQELLPTAGAQRALDLARAAAAGIE